MIKKTSETRPLTGTIVNDYNDSQVNAYSTEYVNNLNTYSTTEQRVGTWIDGKPIYRKVFVLTNQILLNFTWQDVVDISGLGIDAITSYTPLNTNNIAWYCTLARITSGKLQLLYSGREGAEWYVKTLVLEYTKTTD